LVISFQTFFLISYHYNNSVYNIKGAQLLKQNKLESAGQLKLSPF